MIRTITLSGAPGHDNVEVRAICRGDLALHPAHLESGWRVTHIPTGEAIGHFPRCRNARRAMRHLAPFDWHFLAHGDPKYAIVRTKAPPIVRRCGGRVWTFAAPQRLTRAATTTTDRTPESEGQ